MNNSIIRVQNGLGDKLLDVIGFYVICKYLNYIPNIELNSIIREYDWGNNNYDTRLFNFNDLIKINNSQCPYFINSPCPSSSLCPYKVYIFLKNILPEITFEEISSCYKIYSKEIIKPSEVIISKIPYNIENAYGIHLRKSDKVKNGDIRHENTIDEFQIITDKLLVNIKNIILNEDEPVFLVVSEDEKWKNEIKNIINNTTNKKIQIIDIDYTNENNYDNYKSVLDMFCLSKCKNILQGVKYSTFSILASILGNCKLINYSHYLNNHNICLIHTWSSVIEINNIKNFDVNFHKTVTNSVNNIDTNITKKYT